MPVPPTCIESITRLDANHSKRSNLAKIFNRLIPSASVFSNMTTFSVHYYYTTILAKLFIYK